MMKLGQREAELLNLPGPCIVLRCAPLDQSLPYYLDWARRSGTILSSFHDSGVAWLPVTELRKALSAMPEELHRGRGGALDVTGPPQISMPELAAAFTRVLGTEIGIDYLPPQHMAECLQQSGMSPTMAAWTARLQAICSDPALPAHTETLAHILGRPPHDALEILSPTLAPSCPQENP